MRFKLLVAVFLVMVITSGAWAKIITYEQLFGATNINAATGAGKTTAAFSERGELTVLRWPNPSYYDHICYLSSNAEDARELTNLGALPSMGAFMGIVYKEGANKQTTWLRDQPWESSQTYLDARSNVVKTKYINNELGIKATTYAFVHPSLDVLVWRLETELLPGSTVEIVKGMFYENISPATNKTPYAPIDDWLMDMFNDYAGFYDQQTGGIIHFKPYAQNHTLLDPILKSESPTAQGVAEFLENNVPAMGGGMFLAVSALGTEGQYQVGQDDTQTCAMMQDLICNGVAFYDLPDFLCNLPYCSFDPLSWIPDSRQWDHRPTSALADAQDGDLSMSNAAGVQTNGAIGLALDEKSGATIIIAAAESLETVRGKIGAANESGYTSMLEETLSYWHKWTSGALVPDTEDQTVVDFAVRSLISLKTAQDHLTGNIVASISSQPPYFSDWPRDAAFLNYALDLAGFRGEVTLHNLNYIHWQRKNPILNGFAPAGTYHMNYDPRGNPGGPILFEIDNTGLITWSLWDHYLWLKNDGNPFAERYLEEVYPAIALAADALAVCEDEATGLQCFATEDDHPLTKSQTMQGTSTVYAALKAAADAGTEIGDDPERVQIWADRRDELLQAAFDHMWDPVDGRFTTNLSGEAWAVFPAEMLDIDDPRLASQVEYLLGWSWDEVSREKQKLSYSAKAYLSVAWYCRQVEDEDCLDEIQEIIRDNITWLVTKGTLHFGEVSLLYDNDYDGLFETPQNEVAIPHVWRQSLNYIASIYAFGGVPLPQMDDDDDAIDDDDDDAIDDDDDDVSASSDDDDDDDEGCCG